jgi:hypothetical protein
MVSAVICLPARPEAPAGGRESSGTRISVNGLARGSSSRNIQRDVEHPQRRDECTRLFGRHVFEPLQGLAERY